MSVRVMTAAWAVDLPAGDKLVLLALADCASDEGVAWPSIKTLCKKAGKSERAVQGSIKALVEAGHLTRDERIGKGCLYTVHPRSECAPAETAPPQKTTQTPAESAGKPSRTIKRSEAKASSRRKPEVSIPSGFPNAALVAWAKTEAAEQNRLIKPDIEANRFRAHAEQADRRCRDWPAAWRNWIWKAIGDAPLAGPVPATMAKIPPFPNHALRAVIAGEEGEGFCVSYLDPCEWIPPNTIRPANGFAYGKLRHMRALKDLQILDPARAA